MAAKILIIDDDVQVRQLIGGYIKSIDEPFEILMTPNGEIGLETAIKAIPDIIIMDWQMPGMSGIQVLEMLKENPVTMDVPVIIVSGVMAEEEHLAISLETGAVDFLRKPFLRLEFIARIKSAIKMSRAYQEVKKQHVQIEELLRVEKELKKEVVDKKERELLTSAMQVNQKNDLLVELKKKLQALPESKELMAIIRSIHTMFNNDKYWNDLKLHFEEVHPIFFSRLLSKYPSLTQNEMRLCIYIKLHMSNKSIAQMLNLTLKGMETARYRLKKKFNLSASDDLNQHLIKFE